MDESPWGFESLSRHQMKKEIIEKLEKWEEKIRENQKRKKKRMPVSGKSLLKLQRIIQEKSRKNER